MDTYACSTRDQSSELDLNCSPGYGAEFFWAVAGCGMRNAEFCENCFGLVVPWGSVPMPGGMFYDLYRAWSMPTS